jgi:hypothetical protein
MKAYNKASSRKSRSEFYGGFFHSFAFEPLGIRNIKN